MSSTTADFNNIGYLFNIYEFHNFLTTLGILLTTLGILFNIYEFGTFNYFAAYSDIGTFNYFAAYSDIGMFNYFAVNSKLYEYI